MPTPEGFPSLEEAFGQAAADSGFEEPTSDDLFGAEQPAGKTPAPGDQEQTPQETPAPEEQADESLFTELLTAEPGRREIEWNSTVELPGHGQVTLSEMRDGYLRQADYTKKTQTLAAERKAFEEEQGQASRLYKALVEDPAGTAAYLAVQTGVVDEQAVAGKVRSLQSVWKPPPSREEMEAELDKRVAAEVQKHPAVLEAQRQALVNSIETDFARIQQKHGIKLTEKDKAAILQRAVQSGTPDLELVTESMLRRLDKVRQERELAREAATPRPGVRAPSSDTPAEIKSMEDALNLALSEMQKGGG